MFPGTRRSSPASPADLHHRASEWYEHAARWATHLDAASLVNELDGTSTVLVRVLDQAALHGLLQKIRDLGLPLVSVTPSEPDRADHAPIDPQ